MMLRTHIANTWHFIKSETPIPVLGIYYKGILVRLLAKLLGTDSRSTASLMAPINEQGRFTSDWFDSNAKEWIKIFESEKLAQKPIGILEIGSWEGRSTSFFLHYLPLAHVTAVDTWQGSDEHAGDSRVLQIEGLFDSNLSRFGNRLTKAKSRSHEFFSKKDPNALFDLIYVDGSHHADDVIVDAVQSFMALKTGGVLIFDDYTWALYKNTKHNPAFAINCFLKMKKGEYKILSVTSQIIIKKLAAPPAAMKLAA